MDKKLIAIYLLAIVHAITGCTFIPSTHSVHMVKAGNYLYAATTNPRGASADYVTIFDTINNNWKTVKFDNIDNPRINNMLSDNDSVIVQVENNRYKGKNYI